ncbi:sprouty-related, EVH1 domain-containing protein 3 [Accipiter gentilis]|uniref:sprouty-related, EVH1 domain-containing protein 3 n=1 Tax=Astur gentilis TaxID=8957 RepID=UPI0021103C77|nr:sprouty-related, EVH1 domain-containing protein 3 [Accipiter gentilis]
MLRVRAVVMTRDDSSGGWVPTGGGGLSHVTVTRRREDGHRHRQYLIRGERLRDQAPTLECALRRDLEYNEVTPTFHHWRVGGSRFGLTFQSPADASAFRRGVRGALQALAAGSPSSSSSSSSSSSAGDRGDTGGRSPAPEQPPPSPPVSPCAPHPEPPPVPPTIVTSESSATSYRPLGGQVGTGGGPSLGARSQFGLPVGVSGHRSGSCLGLGVPHWGPGSRCWLRGGGQVPVQVAGSQFGVLGPSSTCWCFGGSQFGLPPPPLGEAEEPPETPPPRRDPQGARGYEDYRRAGGAAAGTPPARVRFQKDPKGSPSCRIHGDPPPGAPSRCVYCRGVFSREDNGRGQCRDAPDPAGRCVRRLSCLWCAESLLYHCMADAEGDFSAPCSCGGGHPHCCARWLAPAALALLVPCLCCYPPLRACHWCGGHCGCCGGRHKAAR